jgi:hypothetical protein
MFFVERRRLLFSSQIPHQYLLTSFFLQENLLRVKFSDIVSSVAACTHCTLI